LSHITYNRPHELLALIHSLLSQTCKEFCVSVYHDGPNKQIEDSLKSVQKSYPKQIRFEFTAIRYNDYGHSLRDLGIKNANSPYLLITNDDNYYVPTFVEEILKAIDGGKKDFVYWNMIHSHTKYNGNFRTYLKRGSIDVGAFVVRTDLAQKIGWTDKGFAGDATYCEQLLSSTPDIRIKKIRKTLFVHN
jgi:hypothetical protein